MGSLAVQPPNGVTRSLTEIFIFLRNNAQQGQFFDSDLTRTGKNDDKMHLIAFNEDRAVVSTNRNTPSWVNVIDEVNYEFTRLKSRLAALREMQNKQLSQPNLSEEQLSPEQVKVKELTEEITTMFGHGRRLIRLLEESESEQVDTLEKIRRNVLSSLMFSLNSLMNDFRTSQANYLRHLDTRKHNLDSFLVTSGTTQLADLSEISLGEELSIDQIQQIVENEHMTKEREKEILRISKSILEMNGIFKDIATMIIDQGAILDRIDYNVEQSATRIKSALQSVEKAENYQKKNKKMHLIVVLAGFAIFLMFLIILTKM